LLLVDEETAGTTRTTKAVVGAFGCVLLVLAVLLLAITAYTALLVYGGDRSDTGGFARTFAMAGIAIVWMVLSGAAILGVALKAARPRTAWLAGLGLFAVGFLPPLLVIVPLTLG
jgi:hypothetical protein